MFKLAVQPRRLPTHSNVCQQRPHVPTLYVGLSQAQPLKISGGIDVTLMHHNAIATAKTNR